MAVPPQVGHLWTLFWVMDRSRAWTQAGPAPVGPRDVEAWCRLLDEELRPWEVVALSAMDASRRAALMEKPEGAGDDQNVSTQPVTPALFDALFGGGTSGS